MTDDIGKKNSARRAALKPSSSRGKSGGPPKKTKRGQGSKTAERNRGLPGLMARELALEQVSHVLFGGHALRNTRHTAGELKDGVGLNASDRGLARLIAATVLRLKPVLDDIIDAHLERALPNRYAKVRAILLCASAQLLALKTPPHAAINIAVEQARNDRKIAHLSGLVNAVLRKVAQNGPQALAQTDVARRAIPDWLWHRWVKTFGEETAAAIAHASLEEAPLDLTVKSDVPGWAERLEATVLVTNTLRRQSGGRIERLDGFSDGAWWVQDAAAAIPARLFGDVRGSDVADLCAAPGGKTAQLASAGANVVAIDCDRCRLARMSENLNRLGLKAELVCADIRTWKPKRRFEFILLDVPCTATGTIRRHPDILHLKRDGDVGTLASLQRELLSAAFELLAPKGTLVYCACSLEPEEGELQIVEFLKMTPDARISAISPGEAAIKPEWLNSEGMLRTLPFHDPRPVLKPSSGQNVQRAGPGLDGFFAARIVRA